MHLVSKKNILLLLIFLTISDLLPGQEFALDYQPIRSFKPSDELINDYTLKFGKWGQKNIFDKEKIRSTFIKLVQQKADFLQALDSLNVLMYTDSISNLLNTIKEEIISANENLQNRNFRIFTYRTIEPNAFSFGEGLILVSTGLLERMPDVDQIAFVMSHEMAHDVLNHGFIHLQRISESMHDEEMKRMFQKAARKRAGRNTNIKNVLNTYLGMHMHHSQRSEFEADSLGYIFFQKAGFSGKEATNALDVLDRADHLSFEDTLNLRAFFNFSEYPFKSYWLDAENSSLNWKQDTSLYFIPDSLKSHPGCAQRIKKITSMPLTAKNGENVFSGYYNKIEKLAPVFSFENLESLINSKDYVMALYLSLHMQAAYPDNKYLDCITVHSLLELGAAFSRNEILEFVEFQDSDYPPGYNQLLTFMHNMNSATLYKLATYYMQHNLMSSESHPYNGFLKIISDPAVKITPGIVTQYEKEYHDSYFSELLKDKIVVSPVKSKK
ncbi:MAG TPA: M48 family metalloprotease [Saprospiraceae bacterium]|nr:M48 family metalloprotease [Saprospiraceae bacterium]